MPPANEREWGSLYQLPNGQWAKWFTPTPDQQLLLDSPAMYLCAIGGVNSGKSSIGALWMAQQVKANNYKGEFLVIAPDYTTVIGATRTQWEKVVAGWIPGKFHPHQTDPHWCSADETLMIKFRSASGAFQGAKPRAVWADEFGLVSETTWNSVKGRVASEIGCRAFVTTTPYPEHDWIRTEIVEEAEKNNPLYFYKQLKSRDNPKTNLVHLEQERKNLADWEYQMRYEGVFSKPPSLVFDFAGCYVDRPEGGLPPAVAYACGVDFGCNDATVVLAGLLDKDDVLWIWWEYYKSGTAQYVEEFLSTIRTFHSAFKETVPGKEIRFICDTNRGDIVNSLRRSNIYAQKVSKKKFSIEVGISLINARARTGRLKIVRGAAPNLQRESLQYRYPTIDGLPVGNVPVDKFSDCADALRYLVISLDRREFGKVQRAMAKAT
jgi:hypothetical protein